jgi:hypothetical protein
LIQKMKNELTRRNKLRFVQRDDFKESRFGEAPSNVFLLTHKCGNNYVSSVFRDAKEKLIRFQTDELVGQMPGPYIGDAKVLRADFLNIRCRNFSALSLEKLLRTVDIEKTRFFLFVRHPASLFRSAVSYHMRGKEEWAVTHKYPHLNNRTLTQALNDADSFEDRLVISMTHFGLVWRLTENWLNCHYYLTVRGANLTVVKTEDLFAEGDDKYFQMLSDKLSHDGFTMAADNLMGSSPIYMEKLPVHSTGEFQNDVMSGYKGQALEMYTQFFRESENFFYSG